MLLQKTEKARAELKSRERMLGLRERSLLLLLADGRKSLHDFIPLFEGEGEQLVLKLVREGYLEPVRAMTAGGPVAAGSFAVNGGIFTAQASRPAPSAAHTPAPTPSAPSAVAADSFEGKRSLATTRMFLFDICERMFARRAPPLAEQFREALRQARDRESMLAVSRDLLAEVEIVAGHERADSISGRIAMLLPPEVVV